MVAAIGGEFGLATGGKFVVAKPDRTGGGMI